MSKPFKPYRRKPIADRFWAMVKRGGEYDCWPWQGATTTGGYGTISIDSDRKGPEKAHRVAFAVTFGPIPTGLFICHHCDNPPCCNPDHLFLGTPGENVRDRDSKGRTRTGHLHGSKNPNAKLTDADIPIICKLASEGMYQRDIAKRFGVCQATIWHVLRGSKYRSEQAA